MPPVLKLARELYMERIKELKIALKVDVEKYHHLKREVEDIRTGKWDKQLLDKYKGFKRNLDEHRSESGQIDQTNNPTKLVATSEISTPPLENQLGSTTVKQTLQLDESTLSTNMMEASPDIKQISEPKSELESKPNDLKEVIKSDEVVLQEDVVSAPDTPKSLLPITDVNNDTMLPHQISVDVATAESAYVSKSPLSEMDKPTEGDIKEATDSIELKKNPLSNLEDNVDNELTLLPELDSEKLASVEKNNPIMKDQDLTELGTNPPQDVAATGVSNPIHSDVNLAETSDSHSHNALVSNEVLETSKRDQIGEDELDKPSDAILKEDLMISEDITPLDESEGEGIHTTKLATTNTPDQTSLEITQDASHASDEQTPKEVMDEVVEGRQDTFIEEPEKSVVQVDEPAEVEALNEALGDTLIPFDGPKETIPIKEEPQSTQAVESEEQIAKIGSPKKDSMEEQVDERIVPTLPSDQKDSSDFVQTLATKEMVGSTSEEIKLASDEDSIIALPSSLDQDITLNDSSIHISPKKSPHTHIMPDDSLVSHSSVENLPEESASEGVLAFALSSKRSREDLHDVHSMAKKPKFDELPNVSSVVDQTEFKSPEDSKALVDQSPPDSNLPADTVSIVSEDYSEAVSVKSPKKSLQETVPDTTGLPDTQSPNEIESTPNTEPTNDHASLESAEVGTNADNIVDSAKAHIERTTEQEFLTKSEDDNPIEETTTDQDVVLNSEGNKDSMDIVGLDQGTLHTLDANKELANVETRTINSPIYHAEIEAPSILDSSVEVNSLERSNVPETNQVEQASNFDTSPHYSSLTEAIQEQSDLSPETKEIIDDPSSQPELDASQLEGTDSITPIHNHSFEKIAKPTDISTPTLAEETLPDMESSLLEDIPTLYEGAKDESHPENANVDEETSTVEHKKQEDKGNSFDANVETTLHEPSENEDTNTFEKSDQLEAKLQSKPVSPIETDQTGATDEAVSVIDYTKESYSSPPEITETRTEQETLRNEDEEAVPMIESEAHGQPVEPSPIDEKLDVEATSEMIDDQLSDIVVNEETPGIPNEDSEVDPEDVSEEHVKEQSPAEESFSSTVESDPATQTKENNSSCEDSVANPEIVPVEVKTEVFQEKTILEVNEIKQEASEDVSLTTVDRPKDIKSPSPSSSVSRKRPRDSDPKPTLEESQDGSVEKKVKLEDEDLTKSTPVRHSRKYSIGKPKNHESEDENDGYEVSDAETSDSGAYFEKKEASSPTTEDKKHQSWKKLISMIWREIANHRFGAVFMHPIKEQAAPGYYDVIKRPMDLKSIKQRIREGVITTTDEFHRDILLMFQNALMYNKTDSEVYNMAMEMRDQVEQEIQAFKKTEAFTKRVVQETPTTRRKTNNEEA
ncbi:hypothetical protein K7432_011406 [Basidiobolus ranarum]